MTGLTGIVSDGGEKGACNRALANVVEKGKKINTSEKENKTREKIEKVKTIALQGFVATLIVGGCGAIGAALGSAVPIVGTIGGAGIGVALGIALCVYLKTAKFPQPQPQPTSSPVQARKLELDHLGRLKPGTETT